MVHRLFQDVEAIQRQLHLRQVGAEYLRLRGRRVAGSFAGEERSDGFPGQSPDEPDRRTVTDYARTISDEPAALQCQNSRRRLLGQSVRGLLVGTNQIVVSR